MISNKSDSIFSYPYNFRFDNNLTQRIMTELPQITGSEPNSDQWEMILSKDQNTCVIAGAGSGKSTSLINRIIVLNVYLKIPLEEITVFTFTRESRNDLVKNLIAAFDKYRKKYPGIKPLAIDDARRIVRTFHSKLYAFTLIYGSREKPRLFEGEGDRKNEVVDPNEYDMNDLYLTNLSREQKNILYEAYHESFKMVEFKRLIVALLIRSTKKIYRGYDLDYEDVKNKWGTFAKRDRSLASFLSNIFNCDNNLTKFLPMPERTDLEFYANGLNKELGCYVIYAPENKYLNHNLARDYHINYCGGTEKSYQARVKENKVSLLQMHTRVRERWLTHYCLKVPIAIIGSRIELYEFNNNSKWLKGYRNNSYSSPPKFRYVLEGELRPLLIYEAFYAAGQFIESMGFEVEILEEQSLDDLSDDDKIFVQAMIIFWDSLNKYLKRESITRFHDLFNQFSKNDLSYRGYRDFRKTDLASMKHIMIDEFQDISPEIVRWIQSTLKAVISLEMPASLMCVGDDWQSVYSWRGSSPKFSLQYEDSFQSSEIATKVNMTTNYRCYQDLIDTAESAILTIDEKNRSSKKGISAKNHFKISDFLSQKKDPAKLYHALKKTGLIIPDRKEPASFIQYLRDINSLINRNDLYDDLMLKMVDYKRDSDVSAKEIIQVFHSPQQNDSCLDRIFDNRKSIELAFPSESPKTPEWSGYQSLTITSEMDDGVIKRKIDEIIDIADRILSDNDENKPLLLILTRTLRQQYPIREHLKSYQKKHPSRVKILTYHACKGLQAPYTILIGDCFYFNEAPFKNMIYTLTDFGQRYDEVQKDEALRLAYVALTRAEEEAYWYVRPVNGGAAEIVSAYQFKYSSSSQ